MDHDPDERAPASPAETLRLIEAGRAAAQRDFQPDPRLTYGPWGVAWLVGFGLLFLRFGPDGRVLLAMPELLPLLVLYVLLVAAFVISGSAGMRAGRHVRGVSSIQGLRYGVSWAAAFAGVVVIASRFADLLPDAEASLLWSGLSVAVVGVLYIAGAATWQSREMFTLGVWITLVNIGGFLAGPGWHSLAISLAGGGGMLTAGFVEWLRWRRGQC
ncbi:MAG: transporter [Micromonosporaceae bacterium]|nr:transporter [Micromonosporaceae bacterium]